MKRILTILSILLIAGGTVYAQDTMAQDANKWANEWKYAFSPEGRKSWKTEHTLRLRAGFFYRGRDVYLWHQTR